jgi:hypothetical protein
VDDVQWAVDETVALMLDESQAILREQERHYRRWLLRGGALYMEMLGETPPR